MSTSRSLYREIAEYIEKGIVEGRYSPARRLPSDMELARKFNASRPTVVRAMLDLQNQGLIERRAGSGTYIRPRADARPMDAQSFTVGVIDEGLENTEILSPICDEIVRHCGAKGITVVQRESTAETSGGQPYSPANVVEMAERLIAEGVSGVFFAPLELPTDRAVVNARVAELLRAAGIAVVLLDRDIAEFPERSAFDLIGIDNFAAGYQLGAHFAAAGRTKLAFLARPRYPATTDLRLCGVREALMRANTRSAVDFQVGDPGDVAFVEGILSTAPQGIICSNDRTAAILMQSLHKLNKRVPGDIAVAGFDDVRYATLLSVPLTTMRQPCRSIGITAVELMADRLNSRALPPRSVSLQATLVARESTGKGRG